MKKYLILLLALLGANNAFATATTGSYGSRSPAGIAYLLNNNAAAGPLAMLGSQVTFKKVNVMKAVYDVAKLGGSSAAIIKLKDFDGGDAALPKNAIVKQVMIDTVTAFTGTNAPLLSLGIMSTVDLKAAAAITGYSALLDGIPVNTAASAVKVTTDKAAVTATVTVGKINTGKIIVFVEYYLSD